MPQVKTEEQKAQSLIEELVANELDDYSFQWTIELDDRDKGLFYFDVSYGQFEHPIGNLRLRIDDLGNIEIERTEDTWEKIKTYDWTIKYFWMQIRWGE